MTFISSSFTVNSKSAIFVNEKKNCWCRQQKFEMKVYFMTLEDQLYTVKTAGDRGLSLEGLHK